MPQLTPIPFAISSGSAYSDKNNSSELLNMYVQIEEQGSKSNHVLLNTSGLELIASSKYTIYGIYEFLQKIYIATSDFLYEVDGETLTKIGAVSFSKKVIFSDNGIDLMIVGENGYAYTPSTGTLKNMSTETGWFPSDTVAYMDGYFIFNRTGSGQFFISKLYSTEIDPIDWASGESAPDDTVGVVVTSRQLWIIGERTVEVWYDSGDPDFPFTRISGAVSDIGCANNQTLAKIKTSALFVGIDNKVYMTNGYIPQAISTPAIELKIINAERDDLQAFSYTENGAWFYVLHIGNQCTYVFDIDTAQWHKRKSSTIDKWKINGAINIYENGSALGYSDKDIHSLSINHLTENGDRIRREATTLPINKTVNRIRVHEAQLDMDGGFDIEAKVELEMSHDSGKTWRNKIEATTGAVGEYQRRVIWRRLGQTRDAIFRISITDAIPIRISGLWARIS